MKDLLNKITDETLRGEISEAVDAEIKAQVDKQTGIAKKNAVEKAKKNWVDKKDYDIALGKLAQFEKNALENKLKDLAKANKVLKIHRDDFILNLKASENLEGLDDEGLKNLASSILDKKKHYVLDKEKNDQGGVSFKPDSKNENNKDRKESSEDEIIEQNKKAFAEYQKSLEKE